MNVRSKGLVHLWSLVWFLDPALPCSVKETAELVMDCETVTDVELRLALKLLSTSPMPKAR